MPGGNYDEEPERDISERASEKMHEVADRAKARAQELELRAEEKVEETGHRLVQGLRNHRAVGALAAGGAAFAVASVVGAAEVAVAAAGAYAAYRWLGGPPIPRGPRTEESRIQHP